MLKHCLLIGAAIAAGLWSVPAANAASDAVVLYSAGIDGILDDPKDAGLHAALLLMEKHGLSLPPDASDEDALAINTAANLLLSELDLRMRMDVTAAAGGMPFSVSLTTSGNAGSSADSLLKRLELLLKESGTKPAHADPDRPGLMTFHPALNAPQMWYGLVNDRLEIGVNGPPEASAIDWSGCGLPSGVDPLFGMIIDFNELQPLMGMAAMMSPEAAGMLSGFGLMGPDPLRLEFAMGRGTDRMHLGGRIKNYGKHFGGDLVAGGVRAADLAVVPQDAVDVQVNRYNLSRFLGGMLEMANSMAPPMGDGPDGESMKASDQARQMAKMMLGVDPKTELIDYLGDTITLYRSESTGGGGLMSSVMLVELSNADGMATTLGTLSSRINAMAAPMTEGYVQFANWSHADCGEVVSLVFPGLPIPAELSFVVKGDWLVVTLSPQAMVAACQQLDAKTSLVDNPRFASSIGNKALGAMQVNFTDLPAQLSSGYCLATALGAAISNYTRPRNDADSGIVMTLPTLNELKKGARPCAVVVRSIGDDLIYSGTSDSSINVLMTGVAANLSAMLPVVVPIAAGIALPAMAKARESARRARDAVQAAEQDQQKEDQQ